MMRVRGSESVGVRSWFLWAAGGSEFIRGAGGVDSGGGGDDGAKAIAFFGVVFAEEQWFCEAFGLHHAGGGDDGAGGVYLAYRGGAAGAVDYCQPGGGWGDGAAACAAPGCGFKHYRRDDCVYVDAERGWVLGISGAVGVLGAFGRGALGAVALGEKFFLGSAEALSGVGVLVGALP